MKAAAPYPARRTQQANSGTRPHVVMSNNIRVVESWRLTFVIVCGQYLLVPWQHTPP